MVPRPLKGYHYYHYFEILLILLQNAEESAKKILNSKFYGWWYISSIILMMDWFCGMVDWQKSFSLISSWDHCQRSSPSRISIILQAGFEPAQNLSSGFVESNCAIVITTTSLHHYSLTSKIGFRVVFFFIHHRLADLWNPYFVLQDQFFSNL